MDFSSHGNAQPPTYDESFWSGIRDDGYAVQLNNVYSEDPGKMTSIAVPIMVNGAVVASIAVIFFKSSLKLKEAEATFPKKLTQTAMEISKRLEDID